MSRFVEVERCPVCGEVERRPAGEAEEYTFAECEACCFVYMSPKMADEVATQYYESDFLQDKALGRMHLGRFRSVLSPFKSLKEWLARRRYDELAKKHLHIFDYLEDNLFPRLELGPDDVVLDVGCSWGVYSRMIHEKFGCEVYGVEPNRGAAAYARSQGVEIIANRAETMASASNLRGRVSLIIFHTALENVNDIGTVMEQIKLLLRPGGKVYIKVRNWHWTKAFRKFNNYAFTPENLRLFLENNGLDVIWMNHAPTPPEGAEYQYDPERRHMDVIARLPAAPEVSTTVAHPTADLRASE